MASGRALFVIWVKKVKKFPILSVLNNSQSVKSQKGGITKFLRTLPKNFILFNPRASGRHL